MVKLFSYRQYYKLYQPQPDINQFILYLVILKLRVDTLYSNSFNAGDLFIDLHQRASYYVQKASWVRKIETG